MVAAVAEPSVFWSVPVTVTGGPPAVIITSLALIRSWLGTTKLLNVCPCSQPPMSLQVPSVQPGQLPPSTRADTWWDPLRNWVVLKIITPLADVVGVTFAAATPSTKVENVLLIPEFGPFTVTVSCSVPKIAPSGLITSTPIP